MRLNPALLESGRLAAIVVISAAAGLFAVAVPSIFDGTDASARPTASPAPLIEAADIVGAAPLSVTHPGVFAPADPALDAVAQGLVATR